MSAEEKDTGRPPPSVPVEKPDPQSKKRSSGCGWKWKCIAVLPILAAMVIYNIPWAITEYEAIVGYSLAPVFDGIPPEIMDQFRSYDIDADGSIDPYEFIGIAGDLEMDTAPDNSGRFNETERDVFQFIDKELGPDSEEVVIVAEMEPVDLLSMTKFQGDQGSSYLKNPEKHVPGLMDWKEPFHSFHSFGVKNFQPFLPPSYGYHGNGQPYYVIGQDFHGKTPHMNYYHPLIPQDNEMFLQTLLAMLHPNAFVNCRFTPRGTVALVRAENKDYYDILLRVHAEFQLNQFPNYPFWFTPGQFVGRLIIRKDCNHLEFFELGISTANSLNIDMEWITGKGQNEVDIGFMPQLKVYAPVPSKLHSMNSEVPHDQQPYNFDSIHWDYEISVEDGYSRIEKTMYPFKEVPYLDYLDAFKMAQQEDKLVHFIMLWGALDDQSC